jgi:hypothetical protein
MAKKTIICATCTSLIVVSFTVNAAIVSLESTASYLLRDNSDVLFGTTDAVAIDLVSLGFSAGDTILLESLGDFDKGPGGDTITDWTIGVFSSSNTLLSPDNSHRVPDAIDAGVDYISPNTWSWDTFTTTSNSTDISEDFRIFDEASGGTVIHIPTGAQFLFVGNLDNGTRDNSDPDGDYALRISSVPVPAATWLFGSGLIGLISIARRKRT